MERAGKKRLKNAIGLLLAPVLLFVLLRWFEFRTVFRPTARLDASGDEIGFPREEVWLETKDGVRLHAWFYPQQDSPDDRVFLICHGNGGNISHRLNLYDVLLRLGTSVLAFDYRGYGQSGGRPTEAGTYLDAAAALEWLRARGYRSEDILVFGESLGGGVASQLALEHTVGGLVLMSSFTSTEDVGAELFPWLPVRTVGRIKYPTRDRLPAIEAPVLIMHSDEDRVIPAHHGRRNFAAAREPKLFHQIHGDHNDTFHVDREAVTAGVRSLLQLLKSRTKGVAVEPLTEPNAANAREE